MGWFGKRRRKGSRGILDELRDDLFAIEGLLQEGNTAAAEGACQRLQTRLAEVEAKAPDAAESLELARIHYDLGINFRQLRQDSAGEQAYLAALRWSTAANAGKNKEEAQSMMAACHNHLGILHQEQRAFARSARYYQQALELRERLFAANPVDETNQIYLGGTLCNLGNVALDQGDAEAALAFYHRSIDMLDRSIPGCDCGCRDMHQNMQAYLTGRPTPTLLALQFLRNALSGRAAVLTRQAPDARFRRIGCTERANHVVVELLVEQLGAPADFEELRRELLDAVSFAPNPVIFDLTAVRSITKNGVALLLHLRGRLVGMGEWPALCGLSKELRATTPDVPWDKHFRCHPTIEAALAEL